QAALDDGYDVVVDAVGSSGSLAESIRRCRTGGRVVVVGTFWDPVQLDATILMKEVALVPAMMYGQAAGEREITRAARLLAGTPELGDALITHRYPLDGAAEAFAAARDRSGGSIKVVL
ncbi:MAG: zinc-binding dehydrogenase, partial [Actinobacteria bacterium]|nr:zinc-binding dehydrogenase [Actinomycetota bacterium]NIS32885.1 zinc-binding dehydrogenase [Actinomycetota bacterium]NIT96523.1 zinc-binding dehydrogenase [Actinomycetota bacterium]NIU20220.1 zinc-binding dehydrogenase [Actinomycetota bacterium]NIU67851.1 zinc-binding dehydrogenase [Actinomycetota bacterium]